MLLHYHGKFKIQIYSKYSTDMEENAHLYEFILGCGRFFGYKTLKIGTES